MNFYNFIIKRVAPFLLFLGVGLGGHVVSQTIGKALLISEVTSVQPGTPFWAAVRIELPEEWHIYWKYPGQTGSPTQFSWRLPNDVNKGPLLWPTPKVFFLSHLINFGYEKEVTFLSQIHPSALLSADKIDIGVEVEWLACRDICVPGSAFLQMSLPVKSILSHKDKPAEPLFSHARKHLPLNGKEWQVKGKRDRNMLILTVESPEEGFDSSQSKSDLFFFPEETALLEAAASQSVSVSANVIEVAMPLNSKIRIKPPIKGVLAHKDGQTGVEIEITQLQTVSSHPISFWKGLIYIGMAFLGGIILNLMPCVFPVLSIKVLSVIKQGSLFFHQRAIHQGLFIAGILSSMWFLYGVLVFLKKSGMELGWGFQLQSPSFVIVLAFLFFILALNLFGVFEIGLFATRYARETSDKKSYLSSYFIGMLTTIAATPCTAPFMGTALGVALMETNWVAFLIFTALGLGISAPFFVLSLIPQWVSWLPKPGAWMETLKQALGFPMLASVLWLSWVLLRQTDIEMVFRLWGTLGITAFVLWGYQKGQSLFHGRYSLFKAGAVFTLIVILILYVTQAFFKENKQKEVLMWVPYTPIVFEQFRDEGRPLFLDFTADWCLTCQVNERLVFQSESVMKAFQEKGIVAMKVDWTKKDEDITRLLAGFGRNGVPFYLYYPVGSKEPVILPEILTPSIIKRYIGEY